MRDGSIEVKLHPRAQVKAIDRGEAGRPTIWEAVGFDACFDCELDGSRIEGGWYACDLDLTGIGRALFDPVFYPNYGAGPTEVNAIPLPFVAEPSIREHNVVRFLGPVKELRLDPTSMIGMFSQADMFRLKKINRFQAAKRMLDAVLKTESRSDKYKHVFSMLAIRLLRGGVRGMADWLYGKYRVIGDSQKRFDVNYQNWLKLYDIPRPDEDFSFLPKISIVLPVFNTDERWLNACVDSVLRQRYQNWELCICNDASSKSGIKETLDRYVVKDARIKVFHREINGHISASSNDAVALATGDYVGLLDHDDELHSDALYELVSYLNKYPQAKLIFTDEDKIDQYGNRFDPYFKPDWNPDLILGHNCISHFGVYKRELVDQVGGFRVGMEGSQDWDLALRCIEHLQANEIGHIPRVLYHWRAIPGSTALAPGEKDYAHVAGLKAVNEHLERKGVNAKAIEIDGRRGNYRVVHAFDVEPSVSIIIPTRDRAELLEKCVESISRLTRYERYRIIVVDNQSSEPDALELLERLRQKSGVSVLPYDSEFNYSAINNHAVSRTEDDVIVLLNNDIEVISPDWLTELASNAIRPDVGAVGAMLLYPNGLIQHAGVLLGVHGVAAHAYSGKPRGWAGQMNRGGLAQNYSAVTAACLAVRREVFLSVGGLSEDLRVAFNDIDFCLKLRERGYWNVWLPWVELYHHESATRGYEDTPGKRARFESEVKMMMERWPEWLESDPAYNKNLSTDGEPFTLAFPPRHMKNMIGVGKGYGQHDPVG